jgi:hypothetical protein
MALDKKLTQPAHSREAEALQQRRLSPEAQRALAEADARRKQALATQQKKEIGGRDGPDPARYGDWEVKGIASDF